MPVPILITELSQVAASNFPAGSDSPSSLDDTQRAHAAFIAQIRDGKGFTNPITLASAATTDIGGQNSLAVEISGSATISSFGTNYNGPRFIRFASTGLLTHNATTLNLPGGTTINRAVGDTCIAYPNLAGNGWNVVQYQRATAGANNDITSLTGLTSPVAEIRQIQPISATAGGGILTINASALALEFRSTTLTSGAVSFIKGTPATLQVPSGATLGTINGVQSRIVVLALNNTGTIELAVVNIAGGTNLDETGLISTTAISAASNSASVVYSTTARTSVAYRVIGYVESTQATAGTWATAPSTVQGRGGQALAAMSSLGYGQTWQNVTGSRALATNYYNTTGKPITVFALTGAVGSCDISITVSGLRAGYGRDNTTTGGQQTGANAIVPVGAVYQITSVGGTLTQWHELR